MNKKLLATTLLIATGFSAIAATPPMTAKGFFTEMDRKNGTGKSAEGHLWVNAVSYGALIILHGHNKQLAERIELSTIKHIDDKKQKALARIEEIKVKVDRLDRIRLDRTYTKTAELKDDYGPVPGKRADIKKQIHELNWKRMKIEKNIEGLNKEYAKALADVKKGIMPRAALKKVNLAKRIQRLSLKVGMPLIALDTVATLFNDIHSPNEIDALGPYQGIWETIEFLVEKGYEYSHETDNEEAYWNKVEEEVSFQEAKADLKELSQEELDVIEL